MRKLRPPQPKPGPRHVPRVDDDAAAVLAPGPDAIDRMIARLGPATVIDALAPMVSAERAARIDLVLAARLASVVGVVEDVYDPFNGAAVIRTSEALGLHGLHVIETGLRFQAAKGITRGCHRWMAIERWPSARACVDALHGRGFAVYATTPGADHTIDTVDVGRPIAVVFGNEHAGLPAATVAACDGTIALPMHGFTQSYNLSVSAALALAQLAGRRRAVLGATGDLPGDQIHALRARWFALKVRGAVGMVERIVAGETRPGVATQPHSRDNT
ncbi:MAG: RNA methyltransferase [Myxococcales bacterium]|nr:RNA methyltransferase [Myxococcales bacterium]